MFNKNFSKILLFISLFCFSGLNVTADDKSAAVNVDIDTWILIFKANTEQNYSDYPPLCMTDISCTHICDYLYQDSEYCKALNIMNVKGLLGVYERFFEASYLFSIIDLKALKTFLSIGELASPPWNEPVVAKNILHWIAQQEDAMNVFKSAHHPTEVDLVRALFLSLDPDIKTALRAPLGALSDFLTFAVRRQNNSAMSWVYDVFEEECGKAPYVEKVELCIFEEFYCQATMLYTRKQLVNYEKTKSVIEKISMTYTPKSPRSWWSSPAKGWPWGAVESICDMNLIANSQ